MESLTKKWFWLMDYCKKKHIPPAQKWAWDMAEKAYERQKKESIC